MFYGLFIAHVVYKIVSLVYGFLFLRNLIPLHQVMIHLAVTAPAAMVVFWYYTIFIQYPNIFLDVMKISLTASGEPGKTS